MRIAPVALHNVNVSRRVRVDHRLCVGGPRGQPVASPCTSLSPIGNMSYGVAENSSAPQAANGTDEQTGPIWRDILQPGVFQCDWDTPNLAPRNGDLANGIRVPVSEVDPGSVRPTEELSLAIVRDLCIVTNAW